MTTSAVPATTRATGSAQILNVASLAVTVVALAYSWLRFPAVWTNDRSHGYVIAALCVWLIWRDRAELRRVDPPLPATKLLLIGVSLLWMMGVALSAQVVHLALAPAVLLLWLLVVRGERAATHGVQIAAAFSLAVPMWEALTGPLQSLTVMANTVLVFITRIPATIEGTMIHLPAGTLQVAYSCAGINYLMSGLTLGTCYAFLFTANWKTRLKIVLAAGAVSILSNWIRVFGLVVIGHVTKMQSSLMKDHVVYGWIIFGLFLPLFFYIARRIEEREASKGSVTVRLAAGENEVPSTSRFVQATAAAIVGPVTFLLLAVSQKPTLSPDRAPGVAMAASATGASPSGSWKAGFSGEAKYLRGGLDVDGTVVAVERFIYGRQEQSSEMIGSDNSVAPDSAIAGQGTIGPLDDQLRTAREVAVRTKDGSIRLVWYWYHVSATNTPSTMKAKLLELWSFINRQPSSEIVVVSADCIARDCQSARSALYKATTGQAMPQQNARPGS